LGITPSEGMYLYDTINRNTPPKIHRGNKIASLDNAALPPNITHKQLNALILKYLSSMGTGNVYYRNIVNTNIVDDSALANAINAALTSPLSEQWQSLSSVI